MNQPVSLPEACSSLPPRAQKFLIELVKFGRYHAVRSGTPNVTQTQFHVPQWLLARAFGCHESTLRNWFKRPEMRHVAATTEHYQDGYYHRLKTGMVISVVLFPGEHTRAKLVFERGAKYRDLMQDAEDGRVRASYFPREKSFLQALIDWVFRQPKEDLSQDDALNSAQPVENHPDVVLDRITDPALIADAIINCLGDSPSYKKAWTRVLLKLRRRPERDLYLFHTTLNRFLAARNEGLRKPGMFLLMACKEAGWI